MVVKVPKRRLRRFEISPEVEDLQMYPKRGC
jgi:hypothetical protein